MSRFILLLILILPFYGSSQISDEMKNKSAKEIILSGDYEELLKNIYGFVGEELDSIDVEIMSSGPMLGVLLVKFIDKEEEFTYGMLYETFVDLKKEGGIQYQKGKEFYMKINPLKSLPATEKNWNRMKKALLELEGEAIEIVEFEPWVIESLDENKTLSEVLDEAFNAKRKDEFDNDEYRNKVESLFISDAEITFDLYKDLSEAVDKPMVLYFTGYNCVNCRKLEEGVFKNPIVLSSLTDDFVFFPAYIDSRQELIEELQGTEEYNGRTYNLKTNGDYNMLFQIKHFNMSTQPYLVFMYSNGDIIETASYESHNSVRDMKELMKEVLEKYHSE